MKFLLISYPNLSLKDFTLIQSIRQLYDKQFSIINPHFTFIFPSENIEPNDFILEVKHQLKDLKPFSFSLRCATINKDSFSDYYNIFLVPDEGYSQMVKVHDKLYRDKLHDHLRLDIDYIPHITIGNSIDKFVCKEIVDELNSTDFCINGSITSFDVILFENNKVTTIEKIELQK
jgi:2'-5' RNA ligase